MLHPLKTYQSLPSLQESNDYVDMDTVSHEHMAMDANSETNSNNGNLRVLSNDMSGNLMEDRSFLHSIKDYFQNVYLVAEMVFCIVVAILGPAAPSRIFGLTVHERDIPYQKTENGDIILDMYINRDYVDQQSVPDWQLGLFCIFVPFIVVILYSAVNGYKNDVHAGACAFLFAIGSTGFITNSVKLYAGYWRPNFYNYCAFNQNDLQCEAESEDALIDSRLSFPSGHSSVSFCGMTFITLFFIGKIGLYRGLTVIENSCLNESTSRFLFKKRILTIIASFPMLFAVFVASSRVHDDMHHPADVVTGSLIGMMCSTFSYGLWYSPISSCFSGYSIQTSFDIVKNQH